MNKPHTTRTCKKDLTLPPNHSDYDEAEVCSALPVPSDLVEGYIICECFNTKRMV